MTRHLLMFARQRIDRHEEHNRANDANDSRLTLRLGATMHRLETFVITHPHHAVNDDQQSVVEEWVQFSRADILDKIKRGLAAGDVANTLLYWVRHKAEFVHKLVVDDTGR